MLHSVVSITILCNDLADGVEASADQGQEQGNSMVLAGLKLASRVVFRAPLSLEDLRVLLKM